MAREVQIGNILKRIKRPISLIDDQEYKLVTIRMNHKGVVLREKKQGALIKSGMFEVRPGDFILSGIDARNGAFGIVPSELDGAIVTNDFWYFEINEEIISKELFLELTATTWFDEICKRGSDGTTQRIRLQSDKFFNQTILLPELEEQGELLTKIHLIKEKNGVLTKETESQKSLLSQLKQSILQEAIQGKLTEEWRELRQAQQAPLEPASELIKRIQTEKARLIKEKKIKKEKPLPPITESEKPFDLPEGWEWCRLGDLGEINPRNSVEDTVDVSFIPMASISEEFGIQPKSDFSRKWAEVKSGFTHFGEDDVAVAKITPCFENSKAAIFKNLINGVGAGTTELHVFRNVTRSFLNTEFIYLVVKGPLFLKIGESKMTGTAGQKRIPLDFFKNWILAFPPLEEQQAIVEKVESLMEKCRSLEEEISQSEQQAQMLMQAVLKEAFEKNIE